MRSSTASNTTHLLLTKTLPHCHTILSSTITDHSPERYGLSSTSAAQHIDLLGQSQILSGIIQATLTAAAVFLVQGLSTALAGWNLKVVSRLLFVEGPTMVKEVERVVLCAGQVCPPQLNFPTCSGLHMTEWTSRQGYSVVHTVKTQLKVIHW